MAPTIDQCEWCDLKDAIGEAFDEVDSTLKLKWIGANVVRDPEFGHALTTDNREVELPYTQILSASRLKVLDKTGTDFVLRRAMRVYIPSDAIRDKVPGGVIKREEHIIELNEVEYQIEAVVPYPMLRGESVVHKLHLTLRRPSEQDQGDYGG